MATAAIELKDKGNEEFKLENFDVAVDIYSAALRVVDSNDSALKTTLYINKAAAFLKLNKFEDAVADCKLALELNSASTKAYYRCAQAQYRLGENRMAFDNLQKLLSLDPKNKEGITLMRVVRQRILDDERNSSPVSKVLKAITDRSVPVSDALKELARLCIDERYNALDFGRRGGIKELQTYILSNFFSLQMESSSESLSSETIQNACLALRIVAVACTHSGFVQQYVHLIDDSILNSDSHFCSEFDGRVVVHFRYIARMLSIQNTKLALAACHAVVQILKSAAEIDEETVLKLYKSNPNEIPPIFSEVNARTVLRNIVAALSTKDPEVFVAVSDCLNAFVSDSPQYFNVEKLVDTRYENMDDRKIRLRAQKYLRERAQRHSYWALEMKVLPCLVELLDAENTLMRQRSGVCVGHLLKFVDNESMIKDHLQHVIDATDVYAEGVTGRSIAAFRKRASLESALFMSSKPELGVWSLEQREGIQQLLMLVSSGDIRCQEVAAEVMCQAASTEGGSPLLGPILSSGVLETLLQSPNQGIRAAAASTMTKLSIKAKAFENEAGTELTTILNSVVSVLKSSSLCTLDNKDKIEDGNAKKGTIKSEKGLVSFSKLDNGFKVSNTATTGNNPGHTDSGAVDYASSVADLEGGLAYVSVERAVEVLAALVGKTFVKEEIVHGSYRIAPAIAALVAMEVDPRSTAAYGIAHILAALTVSNHELRARALAEKDMSPEQYEQLAELQRIKTKDENGNVMEERKPDTDPDTPDLVKRRILRIVKVNGIPVLLHLLANTSNQTKDAASRAIRQICVEESVRGQFVQLGGLKSCCAAAIDEENQKPTRRECAHAVAKALVTTNPTMLTEHVRLGCMAPLLMLCRDPDSTNLQQFEACLALTNLTSCGEVEQDRLVAEKGIHAVHYLMFSEHLMVRRAATEVFCNMPSHDAIVKMLRKPDVVRLWLGLSEEWSKELPSIDDDGDDALKNIDFNALRQTESYQTARAAIGTLAVAVYDPEVGTALIAENCVTTVIALLESKCEELIHRVLVFALGLVNSTGLPGAKHLLEGGVVPALHIGAKLGNPRLIELCREVGMALSAALKSEPEEKQVDSTPVSSLSNSTSGTDEPVGKMARAPSNSNSDSDSDSDRFEELD